MNDPMTVIEYQATLEELLQSQINIFHQWVLIYQISYIQFSLITSISF